MSGMVSILNVGEGDTKLTFDNKNPAETIRASRIVVDMIRRGYALLVEVGQPDGTKAFQRVKRFDETKNEYIIADFKPRAVGPEPQPEMDDEETGETSPGSEAEVGAEAPPPRKRGVKGERRIRASGARAVAVARSAGG